MRFFRPCKSAKPFVRPSYTPRIEMLEDRSVPATLIVNSSLDDLNTSDNFLTLREAITALNNGGPGSPLNPAVVNTTPAEPFGTNDTITFDTAAFPTTALTTIAPQFALPTIITNQTISGPGPGFVAISGIAAFRVLDVNAPGGTFGISGVTIQNGAATVIPGSPDPIDDGSGAGVRVRAGTLFGSGLVFKNNSAEGVSGGLATLDGAKLVLVDTTF